MINLIRLDSGWQYNQGFDISHKIMRVVKSVGFCFVRLKGKRPDVPLLSTAYTLTFNLRMF